MLKADVPLKIIVENTFFLWFFDDISKEQNLFYNIINVFNVTFYQFNAYLLKNVDHHD